MSRRRRRRLKKVVKRIGFWVLIACVVLAIDGAYSAWNLKNTLEAAADHLRAGSQAARESDFDLAESEFDAALGEAESAALTAKHPAPFVGQYLPVVGKDANAVRRLARVAELTSKSGVAAIGAAKDMGASNTGLAGSVFSNGVIDFDAVRAGHPYLRDIDQWMADATELIAQSPTPSFYPVETALEEARDRVPSASAAAHKANVLFDAMPDLFAEEGQKTYLLIFQAPSDQRGGGGGLIGLYGLLQATEGRIELVHLGSPYEEKLSPVKLPRSEVPDWYARSYGWASALKDWRSVNISPNFPVVSEVLLKMYELKTGDVLDGVVSLDPVAFAELTKATGPLDGSGMDAVVTPDNAVQVLASDVYTTFNNDNNSQNSYLESVMQNFWSKFSSGEVEPVPLAEAFSEAARTQHFKMYVRGSSADAAERLGITADYTKFDPNVQMVFNENIAGNKVDYFLHRTVATEVRLRPDGSAEVTATATMENRAPHGPPSLLLGPGFKNTPIGLNAMYINFLMPDNAQIESFTIKDKKRHGFRLREEDHPIVSDTMLIKAGQSGSTSVTYTVPDAAEVNDSGGSYVTTLWPHTTINPDRYRLTVVPPYGYQFEPGEGVAANGARFDAEGLLDQPRTFRLDLQAR